MKAPRYINLENAQWRVSSGVLPAAPLSRPEDRSRRLG